jgi:hypothetical protein
MNIVYTNLQENDFGVKRSVRRLEVEFNRKTPNRGLPVSEEGLQNESKGGRRRLLSDSLFWHRRQRVDYPDPPEKERNLQDTAEESSLSPELAPLRPVQNAGSVAGFYIRRFIENQLRTTGWGESGRLINILV